jgi:hypothetical protein
MRIFLFVQMYLCVSVIVSTNAIEFVLASNNSGGMPFILNNLSEPFPHNQSNVSTFEIALPVIFLDTHNITTYPDEPVSSIFIVLSILCAISVLIIAFLLKKVQKKNEFRDWLNYSYKNDNEIEDIERLLIKNDDIKLSLEKSADHCVFEGVKMNIESSKL